jgi:hypothetical protein
MDRPGDLLVPSTIVPLARSPHFELGSPFDRRKPT